MNTTKDLILGEIKEIAGIDASYLFDIGLIPADHARNWVVKHKYFQLAKTGRTYLDIKNELSIYYGISVSTIEKMIYKK